MCITLYIQLQIDKLTGEITTMKCEISGLHKRNKEHSDVIATNKKFLK